MLSLETVLIRIIRRCTNKVLIRNVRRAETWQHIKFFTGSVTAIRIFMLLRIFVKGIRIFLRLGISLSGRPMFVLTRFPTTIASAGGDRGFGTTPAMDLPTERKRRARNECVSCRA